MLSEQTGEKPATRGTSKRNFNPFRSQPVAWKEYCAKYWLKELQESMDRCTGRRDITKILLKAALNTIQPIKTLPNDKS